MAHIYQHLKERDDIRSSEEESQDNESLLGLRKPSFVSSKSNVVWFILHLLVTLGLLITVFVQSRQKTNPTCPKRLPLELPWAEDAIEYETKIIQPSGFGKLFNFTGPVTEYEGYPTPEIDARWHELSKVGIYSITPQQNQDFFGQAPQILTVDAPYGPPHTPVVQIEVFHQIHCLNYIRHRVYNMTPEDPGGEASIRIHTDHCIDYLRQVLMCHGDLTPITHFYHETKMRNFWPNFTVPHTCRKWEKIVQWAEEGAKSGMTIE